VQVPADACGQLHRGKGFGHNVHRAPVERLDPGGDLGDRRQHDHRRAGLTILQRAEDLEPTPPRHGEVEEDQIHIAGVELVQRSLTVSGLTDCVALGRK